METKSEQAQDSGNGHESGSTQRTPREIEAEIARTREELDGTLNALEEKLSPRQLLDELLAYAGDLAANLGNAVRRHPVPVTAAALGLGYVFAPRWRNGSSRERSEAEFTAIWEAVRSALAHAPTAAANMAESVTGDGAAKLAREALQQAERASEFAREQAGRARDGFEYLMREQPLLLGAAGLVLGALLGAAFMGARRDVTGTSVPPVPERPRTGV